MNRPLNSPENPRNAKAVAALLDRVRNLDDDARNRLLAMLDDEMDLPYLDVMEREYASFFRQVCPEQAAMLRGRFVNALNSQREHLVGLVRNALQQDCNGLHNEDLGHAADF